MNRLTLNPTTEEEASSLIIQYLTTPNQRRAIKADPAHALFIPAVVRTKLFEKTPARPNPTLGTNGEPDLDTNTGPFHAVAWDLCRRGILYPSHVTLEKIQRNAQMPGDSFGITEYGKKWLESLDKNEVLPSDHGKFSTILAGHSPRFGSGYDARSQEALGCYRAQLYLSCCAMCGAAAESILLALCIEKTGDRDKVLKEYEQSGGRGKLERTLLANRSGPVHQEIPNFMSLLKHWRDSAAHGSASEIGEEEAFLTMILLMRFARFADDRWEEITGRATATVT